MTKAISGKFSSEEKRVAVALAGFVLIFVAMNLTQDLIRSDVRRTPFYFSESFIFSSFWWLFAPLLFTQFILVKRREEKRQGWYALAVVSLPIVLHLFAYPVLVWLLSDLFYYHTYAIKQTLGYTVSELFYLLVLFYTVPYLVFELLRWHNKSRAADLVQDSPVNTSFVRTLIVLDGQTKRTIPVSEVLYFSANSPYISIYHENRHYLLSETLKSISGKLDPDHFVRVHKSAIVNITKVTAYVSRNNGDYDLTIDNNLSLRLSRNYAADFKRLFNATHRLATD